jgi:RHH-type proline utilization regulon transcriptional repressor/proline dehydrogenase/delta 1-pyrroline-5-carboxylate dehydrogenase
MFKASQIESNNLNLQQWKQTIFDNYQVDENQYLEELIKLAAPSSNNIKQVTQNTIELIKNVRSSSHKRDTIEAFLHQYSLDTEEGVVLMCLAEALLRIPDANSANDLIKDKLSAADWSGYLGQSDSWLVNASSWGLVLTGKFVTLDNNFSEESTNTLNKAISKAGEPVIRAALNQVMKFMGKQFVLGRTIKEALHRGKDDRKKGYTHSFDMLGEAAFTDADALKYLHAYEQAIRQLGEDESASELFPPSISIKLSALHPRYEAAKRTRVLKELGNRLEHLARIAKNLNISISIDAEEADRLEISLDLFEQLFRSDTCNAWDGLGLVVQAYSKRALPVLGWVAALAKETGKKIPVRLVKGAYWDSEMSLAAFLVKTGYEACPIC